LGLWALTVALTVAACGSVGVSGPSTISNKTTTGASLGGGSASSSSDTPVISGTAATTVVAGQVYSFTPTASDPAGAPLTFSITNMPPWATFDSTTGQLAGTPTSANVGTYANIQITASNSQATASLAPFAIAVVAQLAISGTPATTGVVGSMYSFQPTTNAAPGTPLTFIVQSSPPWATLDTATGLLQGTPTQAGTFAGVVISVTDGVQTTALPAFTITVSGGSPGNNPPTISGTPPAGATVGSVYTFTPTAADPNGKPLTFSVVNMPPWASFSTATGTLTGAPTAAQVGTYSGIVISVSDGTLSASLPAFSIKVVAPLTISGTPATQAIAGKGYSFQPTTNAPSGTPLTFSVQSRPAWASFSAATGLLSGTPTTSQTGSYPGIVISVTDGTQTVALPAFAIQVVAPLQISGSPPTQAVAGKPYSFQPTTNAPSGTQLKFSIQNPPPWATFSASTGALTGTPTTSQVGTYSNIAISVSNGSQSASLAAFSITVASANNTPPQISGNPPTSVNAGSPYSFTPTVSNPAGGTLTFSIQNPPPWASFNATNGALTGTPVAADAGSYPGIVISVSNGTASASLPAFTVTVNQVSNGTATLNWTAVTTNTNGTTLTDLAGYKIYYGTSPNGMGTVVTLANPSLTTYLVTNLSSGTWYFSVAAYTTSGTVGDKSNVGQKTIP
jgi:hypothetical protein